MNLKNISHILGIFIFLIGAAMLPALVISLILHETAWTAIGVSASSPWERGSCCTFSSREPENGSA